MWLACMGMGLFSAIVNWFVSGARVLPPEYYGGGDSDGEDSEGKGADGENAGNDVVMQHTKRKSSSIYSTAPAAEAVMAKKSKVSEV